MNNDTEPMEVAKEWSDLTEFEIECCLAAHAGPLGLSWKDRRHMTTLRRIFDLGQPRIILAYNRHKMSYCRISEESCGVIKVLIRQYL